MKTSVLKLFSFLALASTTNNANSPVVAAKKKRGPYKKTKLKIAHSGSLLATNDDENKSSTSSNGINQKSLDTSTHSPDALDISVSNSKPIRKSDVNEAIITKCGVCSEVTVNNKKLTVKCGECNNSYHMKCLDESVKPYKGYVWLCKNCESSSEDNDEESGKEEEDKSVNIEKESNKSKTSRKSLIK